MDRKELAYILKRFHQSACYPTALEGEVEHAIEQIVALHNTQAGKADALDVNAVHQIIRDYLPTSSDIADARMYDAARDIVKLAAPEQRRDGTKIVNSVVPCYKGVACNWPACNSRCDGRPGTTRIIPQSPEASSPPTKASSEARHEAWDDAMKSLDKALAVARSIPLHLSQEKQP